MERFYYSDSVERFLQTDETVVLGVLAANNTFELEPTQRDAWLRQCNILKAALSSIDVTGQIYFEYSIPRLGRRADVILLLGAVIFVLEFKVGEKGFPSQALDQVWDYALDLKNFHETSHERVIVPILVSTEAEYRSPSVVVSMPADRVLSPMACNPVSLPFAIRQVLNSNNEPVRNAEDWQSGRYSPTPTIIEAATALYNGHSVTEISRTDAGATNLTSTSNCVAETIAWARRQKQKVVCFVTGVPGAGKTLVGLNIATRHTNRDEQCVFLSGNGPLVAVLREALARDRVAQERNRGQRIKKIDAMREVKMFIQNVHHFRDECLVDYERPPIEHVAIFDEAQRAWNQAQTASFMSRKKNVPSFDQSESEFLISCLDRHSDWAAVICLVGGGQEINTGEGGIGEWIKSIERSFPDWHMLISSKLFDSEYAAATAIASMSNNGRCTFRDELHLAVSMRSFRAENVSSLVKCILDLESDRARDAYQRLENKYPLVITRDIHSAKRWIREKARGSQRFGMLASSQAQRLKPLAVDVRVVVDPIHWFLAPKEDVRSSYYLEDVATEFQVQGLELDWACVTWDADFRRTEAGWGHYSFCGDRWNRILKPERQKYLKNSYRVLLTRARQGMVIVVPEGESSDPTRAPSFYDETFEYLKGLGIQQL